MLHTRSVVSRQSARCGVMAFPRVDASVSGCAAGVERLREKDEQTLKDAAQVLQEMLSGNSIPPDLMSRGRGPMTCRKGQNFKGSWSAPAMYTIGGASAGLQLGGSSTDFVLLVMDEKGLNAILSGKTKLGKRRPRRPARQ